MSVSLSLSYKAWVLCSNQSLPSGSAGHMITSLSSNWSVKNWSHDHWMDCFVRLWMSFTLSKSKNKHVKYQANTIYNMNTESYKIAVWSDDKLWPTCLHKRYTVCVDILLEVWTSFWQMSNYENKIGFYCFKAIKSLCMLKFCFEYVLETFQWRIFICSWLLNLLELTDFPPFMNATNLEVLHWFLAWYWEDRLSFAVVSRILFSMNHFSAVNFIVL